ncbi:MAG: carbon storage regulator [Planctomycetaceae bacterium]|nr:carbon storage regulator [Planctomycetaceae bacterium]
MFVLSRMTSETVVINDTYTVVPVTISGRHLKLAIHAARPFRLDPPELAREVEAADPTVRFTCELSVGGSICIDEVFTLVFVAVRKVEVGAAPKVRLGIEGPRRTKLCCHYADGSESKEHMLGEVMPKNVF